MNKRSKYSRQSALVPQFKHKMRINREIRLINYGDYTKMKKIKQNKTTFIVKDIENIFGRPSIAEAICIDDLTTRPESREAERDWSQF